MQKKLMLLGGIRYLLPVIEAAHAQGYHVITADYLPDNIAHRYSDEYVNVSIVDKEAVLRAAREKKIDGIMSFGVDPGVVSAAYVAEQLGLPFQCGYNTACILQDKSLFRKFLHDNGFNCPQAMHFGTVDEAMANAGILAYPVIVKPVDSAGSKGVTKVDSADGLYTACLHAFDNSISGNIIIETYLKADGTPSGSESFFVNGKLIYNAFYDQRFDERAPNQFTPAIECWPSAKPQRHLDDVKCQLQRLGELLGFATGIFNVEWRVSGGKAYLMEVSPRAGGNRLAEILNYATDVDIILAETVKSVGYTPAGVKEPTYNGHYAIYNIHSEQQGVFDSITIDSELTAHVVEKELRVQRGDIVTPFTGANASLGTVFLRFDDRQQMDRILSSICNYLKISIITGGGNLEEPDSVYRRRVVDISCRLGLSERRAA